MTRTIHYVELSTEQLRHHVPHNRSPRSATAKPVLTQEGDSLLAITSTKMNIPNIDTSTTEGVIELSRLLTVRMRARRPILPTSDGVGLTRTGTWVKSDLDAVWTANIRNVDRSAVAATGDDASWDAGDANSVGGLARDAIQLNLAIARTGVDNGGAALELHSERDTGTQPVHLHLHTGLSVISRFGANAILTASMGAGEIICVRAGSAVIFVVILAGSSIRIANAWFPAFSIRARVRWAHRRGVSAFSRIRIATAR